MQRKPKSSLDTSLLYSKLKYKHLLSEQSLTSKHKEAVKFLEEKGVKPGKIREHARKLLTSGALAGSLLLSTPQLQTLPVVSDKQSVASTTNINQSLASTLSSILPNPPAGRWGKIEPLSQEKETEISHLIFSTFGINAVPKLGDTKLNHVYGLIGAEQHLPRYPGDSVSQHDEYQKSGITSGLGAWGYFARSKSEMTEDLVQKEKYYVAVQTLYLSDWTTRFKYLRDWYKYRKVVVVNPTNGKAVVAVIADAGPASWTGKHFGGSPEVMAYLGLNVGMQKGPVVLYFVDDPENQISLGPLEKKINDSKVVANR